MEPFTRAGVARAVLFGVAYFAVAQFTPDWVRVIDLAGTLFISAALLVTVLLTAPRGEWWLLTSLAVAARALATARGGETAFLPLLAHLCVVPLSAAIAIGLERVTRAHDPSGAAAPRTAAASDEVARQHTEREYQQISAERDAVVRELATVHAMTRIVQHGDFVHMSERLREVGDAIRRHWPDPGVLGVRTRLGDVVIASAELDDRQWSHRAVFSVADGQVGAIEIAYDTHPDASRSALLEAIAEMLRRAIDRHLMMFSLRQSEQRYRSVVEHQSDMVCRYLPDSTLTFVNEAYCQFFGRDRDHLIGVRFMELIAEADRDETRRQIEAAARGERPPAYEHGVLRPDGTLGRHQWVYVGIVSSDGHIAEIQGIGRDVTDQRRTEEALHSKEIRLRGAYQRIRMLAQRLILAQEAERTEIARDLHDDISQQLAALAIELTVIERGVSDRADLSQQVEQVRRVAADLAEKVRRASHALHPGVLRHAGLAAALASHCDALTAQHRIRVTFEPSGDFDDVGSDLALCVYRVAQQALHNVVMHAEATHASVRLARHNGRIELVVADDGRGFDPAKAHVRGIGLMSIEERVTLARGTLVVDSTEGGGSRLRIDVPVGS